MLPTDELKTILSRRAFINRCTLGAAALATLQGEDGWAQAAQSPHFAARAKRVIYLFQSGAPSQLDLFDPKPQLEKLRGRNLPDSVRKGQRLTGMTAFQANFPLAPTLFKFAQHGQSGATLSELLPYTARMADDLCFIKSMRTEQINHDPAITFALTGFQLAGRPSLGSWLLYGLGSEAEALPGFVVLTSLGRGGQNQPIAARQWSSGFLPSRYQGVHLRGKGDPVLYLGSPPGVTRERQDDVVKAVNAINAGSDAAVDDPEVAARIDSLYGEILTDEIGHVGYCAARCSPTGRMLMRRLYPRFARFLAR